MEHMIYMYIYMYNIYMYNIYIYKCVMCLIIESPHECVLDDFLFGHFFHPSEQVTRMS